MKGEEKYAAKRKFLSAAKGRPVKATNRCFKTENKK